MRICNFDPRMYKKSIGIIECPECGMPVQAGMPHPKHNYLFSMKEKPCDKCDPIKYPLCNDCYKA